MAPKVSYLLGTLGRNTRGISFLSPCLCSLCRKGGLSGFIIDRWHSFCVAESGPASLVSPENVGEVGERNLDVGTPVDRLVHSWSRTIPRSCPASLWYKEPARVSKDLIKLPKGSFHIKWLHLRSAKSPIWLKIGYVVLMTHTNKK